jgi:MarR family transcriptional regulator, lower aerobic nicotinate degradation pathway regulator
MGAGGAARLRRLPTRLLSLAATRADRQVNDALVTVAARKWHYAVLATLDEFGPASQTELSDHTGIYRSDLVGVVAELAERGYVERAPDPADRRRNVVTLTGAGHRHLIVLDEVISDVEAVVLAPLAAEERAELTRLLTMLLEHPGG